MPGATQHVFQSPEQGRSYSFALRTGVDIQAADLSAQGMKIGEGKQIETAVNRNQAPGILKAVVPIGMI